NAIMVYNRLKYTLQPEGVENWSQQLVDFQKDLGPAREALRSSDAGKELDNQAVRKLAETVRQFQMMASLGYPLTIPPEDQSASRDDWKTTGASLLETARAGEFHPAVTHLAAIATAYSNQK